MINVDVPRSTKSWYMTHISFKVGPLCNQGEGFDTVKERYPTDVLREARGSYHENYVYNSQLNADLVYDQTLTQIQAAPLTDYPDRILFNGSAYKGLGTNGKVTAYVQSPRVYYHGFVVTSTSVTVYHIYCYTWTGIVCGAEVYEYTDISPISGGVSCKRRYGSKAWSDTGTRYPWTGPRPSLAAIKGICDAHVTLGGISTRTETAHSLTRTAYMGSAQEIAGGAAVTLLATPFGPQLIPYGDLAMEASEKFSRVSVNMLEFLSEIVHPERLIPKLANMRLLKIVSDAYLSINYGVLPTISDLKSLHRSAVKARSFVDRHGFRTASAGRIFYDEVNDVHQVLEQHLKLAIDNEDCDFVRLIRETESLGILPTLENLWDLVPFSFVVDWFTHLGDFLERVDSKARILRFNVRYVTLSHKHTRTKIIYPSRVQPYSGSVSLVGYWRDPFGQRVLPSLTFSQPTSPSGHVLDGAMLLIQRRK